MCGQSLPLKFHNQPSYEIEDIEEYSNFDAWDESNLAESGQTVVYGSCSGDPPPHNGLWGGE